MSAIKRLLGALRHKPATIVAGGALALVISTTMVVGPNTPAAWPDASNTGVPSGTSLTTYSGPNPILIDGTVIDSKTINADLSVQAANVLVKNSIINGAVSVGAEEAAGSSMTIQDSEIDAGSAPETAKTGICCTDYNVYRVEIRGGNRSAYCIATCLIQDSWVHGQAHSTTLHESGIRVETYTNLQHNTITCDAPEQAPDGGCSADVTGYPDFVIIHHNTVNNNHLTITPGSWCLYGGDSPGKQFSGQTHHITITNNVFDVWPSTIDCGIFGSTDSFPTSDPNSVWSNNTRSSDGSIIAPNQ